MTAQTFGRKGQGCNAEMARRREAFIAQERARQANPSQPDPPQPYHRFGPSAAPAAAVKSVGLAYVLWFVFGPIGAHRHYLGYHTSAIVQGGLWVMGWLMILSGNFFLALPVLMILGLWVLADAFIIPSLCRDANARTQQKKRQYVFT